MKPVERDTTRFRYLYPDRPARIPEGFSAPLDARPICLLIQERLDKLAKDRV